LSIDEKFITGSKIVIIIAMAKAETFNHIRGEALISASTSEEKRRERAPSINKLEGRPLTRAERDMAARLDAFLCHYGVTKKTLGPQPRDESEKTFAAIASTNRLYILTHSTQWNHSDSNNATEKSWTTLKVDDYEKMQQGQDSLLFTINKLTRNKTSNPATIKSTQLKEDNLQFFLRDLNILTPDRSKTKEIWKEELRLIGITDFSSELSFCRIGPNIEFTIASALSLCAPKIRFLK